MRQPKNSPELIFLCLLSSNEEFILVDPSGGMKDVVGGKDTVINRRNNGDEFLKVAQLSSVVVELLELTLCSRVLISTKRSIEGFWLTSSV